MESHTSTTIIEHFPVGQLGCVCTIIGDRSSGDAIVVDGGAEPERVIARLAEHGLRARHLLHTHAHIDHVGATTPLREHTGAASAIHPADLPLAAMLDRQAALLRIAPVPQPIFDNDLHDRDRLTVGELTVEVLHTPGHTPGSSCFALTLNSTHTLLTGDTLFAGAVGRWDIGGTSLADIVNSIETKLLPYSDTTIIVPGHGPTSTIGFERAHNPYLQR